MAFQLRYSPLHDISAEQLPNYIQQFRYGLPMTELLDAYVGVERDVQSLVRDGACHILENSGRRIIFPVDSMGVQVDADMRALWHLDIASMPREVELEQALFQQGHLSKEQLSTAYLQKARVRAAEAQAVAQAVQEQKAANRKIRKRVALSAITNQHLLGGGLEFLEALAAKKK